jgi:hypothetical protein
MDYLSLMIHEVQQMPCFKGFAHIESLYLLAAGCGIAAGLIAQALL